MGESAAEIESALSLPPGSLAATLDLYNRHAARGEDPVFHKASAFVAPLEPPYAALDCCVDSSFYAAFTLGGLRTTLDSEVMRPDGSVIPGLYAAGRTSAGLAAPGYSSGISLGDGSYFEPTMIHGAWESYDLNWWYAAPVSGLGFNDNSIDIVYSPADSTGRPARVAFTPDFGDVVLENRTRTTQRGGEETIDFFREPGTLMVRAIGEVPAGGRTRTEHFALPDPNLFTARAFRAALAEVGISVQGGTLSTTDSTAFELARRGVALAEVTSRPLRDWIFPILNTSQNWYSEMLLKQLGRQFGRGGSWEEGLKVERRFLIDSVGIDSTQFALSDGSGLAASNLVSPLAFTQLLTFMRKHPRYATFENGLPLSGKRGSLRTRFIGTPLEGRVRAKTGSISRVNTLSGYIEMPDGKTYIFSVMGNHHALPGSKMLGQIDSVVVDLSRARR